MVEEQLATTTDSRGISARGRPASLSLGLTVAELQLGALRRRPDATALVCEGRRYTYRKMEERVSQVAQLFASKGLGRDDGVAVLAANRAEFIFANWAAQLLGMRYTPPFTLKGRKPITAISWPTPKYRRWSSTARRLEREARRCRPEHSLIMSLCWPAILASTSRRRLIGSSPNPCRCRRAPKISATSFSRAAPPAGRRAPRIVTCRSTARPCSH